MKNNKKEMDIVNNIQEFEQKLRLRGSVTPKRDLKESFNIFERLGLTTSINSEINYMEQNSNIKILAPYSQLNQFQVNNRPNKFGIISPNNIDQIRLNPSLKRMKFINNILIKLIILAIIVNFILIFIL